MTASDTDADAAEERTEQMTADLAAIIIARTVAVAGELHSRALDAEASAEQGDAEALQEIVDALDEASDEIVALDELAQRADP